MWRGIGIVDAFMSCLVKVIHITTVFSLSVHVCFGMRVTCFFFLCKTKRVISLKMEMVSSHTGQTQVADSIVQ